eukprot:COSAG02_NODE_4708_length_5066_cov_9.251307_3_plen_662_part_00
MTLHALTKFGGGGGGGPGGGGGGGAGGGGGGGGGGPAVHACHFHQLSRIAGLPLRPSMLVILLTLLTISVPGLHAAAQSALTDELKPIRGSFLDIQYDGRLKYANEVTLELSCAAWAGKVEEMASFGLEFLIFQAVHDDRFGAYYNSSVHSRWAGACPDAVGVIMRAAAEHGMKVWLSCEYTKTDADGVSDPELMQGRYTIMKELVAGGYTELPSFHGWYFSSEAYLTDTTPPHEEANLPAPAPTPPAGCRACFPDTFMIYINTMSNWSKTLTPAARKFVSPYGTWTATHSPAFIKQLQQLDVDVVAYQDEVGCVRNELPVELSRAAFRNLAVAHSSPGTPALWANVESFTWEGVPNFASSALIPAPFPRILAQLDAVTPFVENIITFTVEAIYQPPATAEAVGATSTQLSVGTGVQPPLWGPPDAQREWRAYTKALGAAGLLPPAPGSKEQVERQVVNGRVHHGGIGWRVLYETGTGAPDPAFAHGNLTDGLTGAQSPWDQKWVGFKPGGDAVVILELPEDNTCQLQSLGVNFLAAPPVFFVDGDHAKPVARNVTTWLPADVRWSVSSVSASGPWRALGEPLKPQWWAREVYDTRTEVFLMHLNATTTATARPKYLRMVATAAPPPWWSSWWTETFGNMTRVGLHVGRLMMSEVIAECVS